MKRQLTFKGEATRRQRTMGEETKELAFAACHSATQSITPTQVTGEPRTLADVS